MGSWLLSQGLNLGPQPWGCRVLSTELPGNFWHIHVSLKLDTSIDNATVSEVFSDIRSMITFLWTLDPWWRSLHWALTCPAVHSSCVYMLILLSATDHLKYIVLSVNLNLYLYFWGKDGSPSVDETWEPSFTFVIGLSCSPGQPLARL